MESKLLPCSVCGATQFIFTGDTESRLCVRGHRTREGVEVPTEAHNRERAHFYFHIVERPGVFTRRGNLVVISRDSVLALQKELIRASVENLHREPVFVTDLPRPLRRQAERLADLSMRATPFGSAVVEK